jgi:hypothetical protein
MFFVVVVIVGSYILYRYTTSQRILSGFDVNRTSSIWRTIRGMAVVPMSVGTYDGTCAGVFVKEPARYLDLLEI